MKPVFCRPVTGGTIIAPIQWLHLWVLHTRSFLLISTLHWRNHGTLAEWSPEVREIYIVGPIRRRMKPVLCRSITGATIIAPIHLLHLWVLHTRSFLLISTLHWCNHGTLAEGNPEPREIYIVGHILRCMKPVFCRPVTRGTIIEPIQWLHLWVLHTRSFLLISTLHWCNHGTLSKITTEVRENYIVWTRVLSQPVKPSAFIAPTTRLHL